MRGRRAGIELTSSANPLRARSEIYARPWLWLASCSLQEARILRRFSSGELVSEVVASNPNPERPLRFIAALMALDYIR